MKKIDLMNTNLIEHIRFNAKEYYFRNGLFNTHPELTNPYEMTDIELYAFLDKFNLNYANNAINYLSKLYYDIEKNLTVKNISNDVLYILNILYTNSENSYLVGGCIRDLILGETPKDWDFVTDISYDELNKIFNSIEFKIKETGKEFLVFNLRYNNIDYEIANFRTEKYTEGSRKPEVQIGNILEDAKRRDFSINSFFWNLEGLIGRTQSFEDMKNKKIRFIGKAEDRLKDDNVRGWRFFRFLSKLKKYGFTADDNSLRVLRKKWPEIYEKSNATRVLLELEKLM